MNEILLLLVGAAIALISSWIKAWIDRETSASTEVYKQRIQALNEIWKSFLPLRTTFAARISLGHEAWLTKYKDGVEKELGEFRAKIDQSQVILPKSVIEALRDLEIYLFDASSRDELKSSDYDATLKKHLKKLTVVINNSFSKRTQAIDLEFRT